MTLLPRVDWKHFSSANIPANLAHTISESSIGPVKRCSCLRYRTMRRGVGWAPDFLMKIGEFLCVEAYLLALTVFLHVFAFSHGC